MTRVVLRSSSTYFTNQIDISVISILTTLANCVWQNWQYDYHRCIYVSLCIAVIFTKYTLLNKNKNTLPIHCYIRCKVGLQLTSPDLAINIAKLHKTSYYGPTGKKVLVYFQTFCTYCDQFFLRISP